MKNVIITGASGMIGKGVLLECLDHQTIHKVVVIVRKPLGIEHPKLIEIIHDNFLNYSEINHQLTDLDACFFCLGVSAAGLKEDQYKTITYDFTLSLAETLYNLNPQMTFNYISGEGTDSSEKGRMMWARVKGKTENDLLKLGFNQAFMFRPGVIIPLRGIQSRTKSYRLLYKYFMWLIKGIKAVAPNAIVNTTQIGQAMINTIEKGYNRKVLKPKDIIRLSK